MDLPPAALIALPADEPPLGGVCSASTLAWSPRPGIRRSADIWVVFTPRRSWLIAVDGAETPLVRATGALGDVRVERRRLGRDRVVFAGQTLLLPRGGADALASLLVAWARGGAGGDRVEPTGRPDSPARATLAPAARGLPGWWASSVPCAADERWLAAGKSATSAPLVGPGGAQADAEVWLGCTDQRVVAAARGPQGELKVWAVDDALERSRTATGDRVALGGGGELRTATLERGSLDDVVAIATAAPGAPRWAAATALALRHHDLRGAIELAHCASQRQAHAAATAALAACVLASGRGAIAVDLLRTALSAGLERVGPAIWEPLGETAQRAAERSPPWSQLAGAIEPLRAAPPSTAPADGLPWPPTAPGEAWGAALAASGRWDEAIASWASDRDGARRQTVLAAALTHTRDPGAPAAWRRAAATLRPDDPARADDALQRALATSPRDPDTHWQRAAWSHADGDGAAAHAHWVDALLSDPEGRGAATHPLDARGWRALVGAALECDAVPVAVDALRRAVELDPADADARWDLAHLLAGASRDHAAAADAIAAILVAHDNGALRDPDRSRWTISASLATELLAADQPDAALDALKDAVAVDCLHPEAWRAALDVDDAPLPEPLRGWWRHVAAVLAGDTPVPPERAPTTLSREALDALHPGGAGWLDSLRHAVDTTAPPERATLVRGLDRVEATRAAWVADCVSAIAERLGMEPPPTYLFRGDDAYGASGWPTEPPVLLVGALHFVEGDRAVDRQALAFPIAVEMAHLACGHPVLAFGHGLVGTGRSVYQVFGRFAGTAEVVVDVLTLVPGVDQLTKLQTVVGLARKVFTTKGTLDKASGLAGPVLKRLGLVTDGEGGHAGREALAGAALQFRMQADRAALLATGDLEAAVRGVLWTSTRSSGLAERVREEGLASLLAGDTDGDDALSAADALRLSALVAFAATL